MEYRPWPIFFRVRLLNLFISIFSYISLSTRFIGAIISLLWGVFIFRSWVRDVTRERTFQGFHTLKIIGAMKFRIILFIISEVIFFVSFFWTFFYSVLNSNVELGHLWPPQGITPLDPSHVPLLNTLVLLSSGVSITVSHYYLISQHSTNTKLWLLVSIRLGGYFTILQVEEYFSSTFTLLDSSYGSIFFITTGFHGLHVLVGSIFLTVELFRIHFNHFSKHHHLGFELACWYWHFVDLVWIFVYSLVYWWL